LKINLINEPIVIDRDDVKNEDFSYNATVVALSNIYPLCDNNSIIREVKPIADRDVYYSYYPLWNDAYWNGYSDMAMQSANTSNFLAVYLDNLYIPTIMKAQNFASLNDNTIKVCLVPDIKALKESEPEYYKGLRCIFNYIIETQNMDGLECLSMFFRPIIDLDNIVCDCPMELVFDHFATCKELYFRQISIDDEDCFSHINFVNAFDDLVQSPSSTSFVMLEYPHSIPRQMIMVTDALWSTLLFNRADNVLSTTYYADDDKCRIKVLTGESELLLE